LFSDNLIIEEEKNNASIARNLKKRKLDETNKKEIINSKFMKP